MKDYFFTTLIVLIACLQGCTSREHSRAPRPIPSTIDELTDFPKVWFTFAPADLKCKNLESFMESYQSAYATDLQLIIDTDCTTDDHKIARAFRFTDKGEKAINIVLNIDFSVQNRDLDAKASSSVKVDGGKDFPFDLGAFKLRFSEWVEKNSQSRTEACNFLIRSGQSCPTSGA